MKNFLEVGLFLILAFCVEALFMFLGLPISIGDIILIALSSLMVFILLSSFFSKTNSSINNKESGVAPLSKLLSCFVIALLLLLGLLITYMGISEPFTLFTGVKGAAHGYSLVITGISIIFVIGSGVYIYIAKKIHDNVSASGLNPLYESSYLTPVFPYCIVSF